jgi:cytochrome c oxidase cbb3-type subunit 3
MPAWGQVLKPDQVTSVVAYVLSLRGTHPASPKEPQGVNADSAAAAAGP